MAGSSIHDYFNSFMEAEPASSSGTSFFNKDGSFNGQLLQAIGLGLMSDADDPFGGAARGFATYNRAKSDEKKDREEKAWRMAVEQAQADRDQRNFDYQQGRDTTLDQRDQRNFDYNAGRDVIGDNQFDRRMDQDQSQFGARMAQDDRQFGARMAQDDRQFNQNYGLQRDRMTMDQDQFQTRMDQDASQFDRNMTMQGRKMVQDQSQFDTNADLAQQQEERLAGSAGLEDQLQRAKLKYFAENGEFPGTSYGGRSGMGKATAQEYNNDNKAYGQAYDTYRSNVPRLDDLERLKQLAPQIAAGPDFKSQASRVVTKALGLDGVDPLTEAGRVVYQERLNKVLSDMKSQGSITEAERSAAAKAAVDFESMSPATLMKTIDVIQKGVKGQVEDFEAFTALPEDERRGNFRQFMTQRLMERRKTPAGNPSSGVAQTPLQGQTSSGVKWRVKTPEAAPAGGQGGLIRGEAGQDIPKGNDSGDRLDGGLKPVKLAPELQNRLNRVRASQAMDRGRKSMEAGRLAPKLPQKDLTEFVEVSPGNFVDRETAEKMMVEQERRRRGATGIRSPVGIRRAY